MDRSEGPVARRKGRRVSPNPIRSSLSSNSPWHWIESGVMLNETSSIDASYFHEALELEIPLVIASNTVDTLAALALLPPIAPIAGYSSCFSQFQSRGNFRETTQTYVFSYPRWHLRLSRCLWCFFSFYYNTCLFSKNHFFQLKEQSRTLWSWFKA